MDSLEGVLLSGRYRVQERIGRGGMGTVYRATDVQLGREVAIKAARVGADEEDARRRMRHRFLQEARSAARIRHLNVVTIHDVGTDEDRALDYFVMELVRGEDLHARVQRIGPVDALVGREILEQAAEGLAAGHRAGLVHRDIKPANLAIEDAPGGGVRLIVLDFGIAQPCPPGAGLLSYPEPVEALPVLETLTQLTRVREHPLTPAYASPEQLAGSDLTPASDLFSLGVTMLHLLSGALPFGATEILMHARGVFPGRQIADAVACVPDGYRHAIQVMLAERPEERPRDADALLDLLRQRWSSHHRLSGR